MKRHEFEVQHAPLRDIHQAHTFTPQERRERLGESFQLYLNDKIPLDEQVRRHELYDPRYPLIRPRPHPLRSHIHPRSRKSP